jgi:hypothetical protein
MDGCLGMLGGHSIFYYAIGLSVRLAAVLIAR